jgi:sigma-B regulation protein RsbU (phosphoserine phosphatase)
MPATPRQTVKFKERAELLDFLLEVAGTISETLDLDRLMHRVGEIVRDVVPFDLFAILLYSERSQGLRIRYSIGHRDEVVRNLVVPLGEGITGLAAQNRTPMIVDDVRSDPRYLNALDAVRSEMAVPMIARGKLVGVIDVQSTRVRAYTPQDRALLRLLASRVATAIDNARLYRRVERQNRTLKTLAYVSHEFSSTLLLDELLGKIARTLRPLIPFDAFSIFLADPDAGVLRHRFSQRYDARVHLDNIPMGKGITGAAYQSREIVRVHDTLADPRYIASHPDIRSEVAAPLVVQDRVVGVLDLESERVGFFTDEHLRTISLLAPQIASSIENARLYGELAQREQRMEQDLLAAREVQSLLLPRVAPEIRGLQIALTNRPAREISGDVYDFFEQGDYAVMAFGDVSGKGAAAALYGALLSGLLRTLAPRRRSPALLMQSLNETLLERRIHAQYATLAVLLWDIRDRRLTLCNAGSEVPLIYRGGEVTSWKAEGIPLGLLEDREYEEVELATEPGDVVLLLSDGICDQLDSADRDYGRARVAEVLRKHGAQDPRVIVNEILADIDRFRGETPLTDDQSLIVLKVTR